MLKRERERERERVYRGREWVVNEKRTTTPVYVPSTGGQFKDMP
jgi:hypothetical protein